MELKPYYDRVLLKRKDAESKSKGGIVLTDGAKEKSNLCTVVAVGSGYRHAETGELTPLQTKEGETVMIGKWAGDEVKIGDIEHILVKESEILAGVID